MLKDDFLLSKEYKHLNHGSFGACPIPIFNDYQHWQLELERNPSDFGFNQSLKQLEISKNALANYIHCNADDLVFTTNPSYAINIIAKSFPLEAGDEILTTNHEYGALDRTWKYYCSKSNAHYIQQEIPIPLTSKEEFITAFWKGYSPKTKAIFISHLTSTTALIFPVKEICARAKELGLITIVDGAHIPGHLPLDIMELNADIYTGACHKWMMTPKGSSFLYVSKELQDTFDPLVISWGYDTDIPGKSKFLNYHQQQGTRDYAAFLTLPTAIDYMEKNDWWKISKQCKELILANYLPLCDIVGSKPICPINSNFLGQMCSIPVPVNDPAPLKKVLFEKYNIEIPIFQLRQHIFMRLSVNAYVSQEDIDYLKSALREIRDNTSIFNTP